MNEFKYKSSRSLILCTTPLQALIAEKIIELNNSMIFDLVMLTEHDNEKYRYYFQRLESQCNNSVFYIKNKGYKKVFDLQTNFRKRLEASNISYKYSNIYIASINEPYFQYIISNCKQVAIYTYDDGAANIVENSIYSNYPPSLSLKRLAWKMLGVKDDMKNIKERSQLHFTIYKDIPNIINKTLYIPLIKKELFNNECIDKQVKIYLGQPLSEISEKLDITTIGNILSQFHIDYYFPHPREKSVPLNSIEIINTHCIFEDYLINYLTENPSTEVEVLTFISSAALNIASLEHVRVKFIYNALLFKNFNQFYRLAEKKFNIDILYPKD